MVEAMPQFRERLAGLFAASSSNGLGFRVSGDTQDRIGIDAGGRITWGSGSATSDLILQRESASLARLTGSIVINDNASGDANSGLRIVSSAATTHNNWRIGTQMLVGGLEFTPSTAVGGTTFSTPAMVILNNSNIGIGTTSPGRKVDIVGRTRHRADGVASAGTFLTDLAGTENVFVGLMGTSSTNAYGVYSSGNWRFNIHNSGGVTIGSSLSGTDPGASNLRVSGTITSDGGFSGALSGNASSATSLANSPAINNVTFLGSTNITIPRVRALDDREIAPADMLPVYVTSAFSTWDNNIASSGPYADTLVFRSYGDATGGSDNMLSLRKDTFGLRVWQQAWGSSTKFTSFKDVSWTDGTNATGTWPISVTGNSATATKFQNGTTINGTSFDGSAAITTANWGTSRTITIGSTGKSVNGSTNVSWTISEIGAAAKSEVENLLGDLMYVGTYDAEALGPNTKPTPQWSGGSTNYRHGMYWVVSKPGYISYFTPDGSGNVDVALREPTNATNQEVKNGDWIVCQDPNYTPGTAVTTLPLASVIFRFISFSAENFVSRAISDHAGDVNDPHSAAGYITSTFADANYAPLVHNHWADIASKISEHEAKTDPHTQYLTESETDLRYYTKSQVDASISNIAKDVLVTDGAPSARVFIGATEPPSTGTLQRFVGDLWFETPNISLQPPAAATNFTASPASTTQINLSWGAWPTTAQQNNVTLQRRVGADWTSPLALVNDSSSPYEVSFSDTGLTANTTYFYRVRASNTAGAGPWTEISAATPPIIDNTPPGLPTLNSFKPVESIFTVTNKQLTSNSATLTTSVAHGFVADDYVSVWGVDSTFNGTWKVLSVTTTPSHTFTFTCTAANVGSTSVTPNGSCARYGSMEASITWPSDSDTNWGEIIYYPYSGSPAYTWTGSATPGATITRNFRTEHGVLATGVPGNAPTVYIRARDSNNNWSSTRTGSYTLLNSPYSIAADSSNSWRNEAGGRYNSAGNYRLIQGYFSNSALNSIGLWYYGTKIADQIWSTNRIFKNVEVYMKRSTGGDGVPRDVSLVTHGETVNPGNAYQAGPTTYETPQVVATLAWGGGTAWATVPSAWYTTLLNGTRKGLAIRDTDGIPYVILESVPENGASGTIRITHLG